jgi:hypothetical protein
MHPSASVRFAVRGGEDRSKAEDGERNDLHSLLVPGALSVRVGDVTRSMGDCFPYLVAEALLFQAGEVIDAWEHNRVLNRRVDVSGVGIGVRVALDGKLALTMGGPKTHGLRNAANSAYSTGVHRRNLVFCRGVARGILRQDRSQASNLRLRSLRDGLRRLAEQCRDAERSDAKINEAPEAYRAFADAQALQTGARQLWGHGRIRFSHLWTGAIPHVDLHGTFVVGDHVVMSSAREVACVHKLTGVLVWKSAVDRGVSTLSCSVWMVESMCLIFVVAKNSFACSWQRVWERHRPGP